MDLKLLQVCQFIYMVDFVSKNQFCNVPLTIIPRREPMVSITVDEESHLTIIEPLFPLMANCHDLCTARLEFERKVE